MKRSWFKRSLALMAALALSLPVAGWAEEMGEIDLYDPAIYVEGAEPAGDPSRQIDADAAQPVPASESKASAMPEEGMENAGSNAAQPEEDTEDAGLNAAQPEEDTENAGSNAAQPEEDTENAESGAAQLGQGMENAESGAAQPGQGGAGTADAGAEQSEQAGAEADDANAARREQPEGAENDPAQPDAQAAPESVEGGAAVAAPAVDGELSLEDQAAPEQMAVAAPEAEPALRMGLGERYSLDGTALFGGAGTAALYASNRPEIAAVDPQTGVVTAVALGTAELTVTADNGMTAICLVEVLKAPGSLSLPAAALKLGKGERAALAASTPEGTASARITYKSSKPKVVSVDAAGNLVAKKVGSAVITATAYNGAKATCAVKVLKAPSKLTLSAGTAVLNVGGTRALSVKLPKKSASRITWESDDPAVVAVDADGVLRGVGSGMANVTARSFNNKRATCKVMVLEGGAPTTLTLNAQKLQLGVKEKYQLVPAIGEGESAMYAWSSSKKKVATVSSNGLITAKKAGKAVITVKTHNGLVAKVAVTVSKAPSKVTLSASKLSLEAGQTAQLAAKLPKGTTASLIWESSDPSVAAVDGNGKVAALKAGTAAIRVTTFNGKTALCKLTVVNPGEAQDPVPDDAVDDVPLTAKRMLANLKASDCLGSKKDAIVGMMSLLISAGFEPAFAAGVGANAYSEGTYGLFESSKYVTNYQKRPRYFCYLDGGNYYTSKNGKYTLTAVYLSKEELDAYTGKAEGRLRFGEQNYYLDNYSGKYAQDVNLPQLEAFIKALADGGWEGKFGIGIVQWTGSRTRKLVSLYRKHAGTSDTLTRAQVVAAENEMILYDFKGDYKGVYTAWMSANKGALDTVEAARSAASLVCTKYEIPVDKDSKAVTRGKKAAEMYKIMIGG